ncbi:PREDICTED: melanoma-associated antigen B4-like [Elephantulus edwardii]|uniref:melanoma-associated antigen B4-like n=1 Tax=Elephantulus edwardii TaxID=28737 RepID=UPI0003F06337|nr:PREDICTED: melanoma-associated antigen B4-like [Elephantulus edwardii]
MPRGHKSKNRARWKRRQTQGETQAPEEAKAAAAEEEAQSPSSSPLYEASPTSGASPPCEDSPPPDDSPPPEDSPPREASPPREHLPPRGASQRLPGLSTELSSQRVPPIPKIDMCVYCTEDDEGDLGEYGGGASSSGGAAGGPQKDPLIKRMRLLVQFLLHKYKIKEPLITKKEIMKIINKKYQERFPEVLQRVSEHMELVFGLELKEVDPSVPTYLLANVLEISREDYLFDSKTFPKYGMLLPILGMIYMNGNQVSEEQLWQFLNRVGVSDGKRHFLFGDPRKLITKDMVQEKYLEYRQVPGSDPPTFQFLWGPKAYTEASKAKVLEFILKMQKMDHKAFKILFVETWREEEEKAATMKWSAGNFNARARARFRAKSSKASREKRE